MKMEPLQHVSLTCPLNVSCAVESERIYRGQEYAAASDMAQEQAIYSFFKRASRLEVSHRPPPIS